MNLKLAEELKITTKVSSFIEAYDFEVYDIVKTNVLFTQLRPILFVIMGLYLAGIYFGQRWMKNRPPYNLSYALFLWNLALAVFSILATIRGFPEVAYLVSQNDGLYSATCDRGVHNFATSFWALMFVLSKIVELGDTAFIVLRKQKLIVLHWFHHLATLFLCWLGYEYYETAARFFVVNTFVHSFMYSYYALKAVKVQIPKRVSRALTSIQILQMIFFLFVVTSYVRNTSAGKPCPINSELVTFGGIIILIFTVLFVNFFVQTYSGKRGAKSKAS
ncbi:unnamed protein product [Allacma fusca]|uniref:Elongation of very long chain fatty acids protein n=1 Tax=Allacma fusca TaxID=39272 RepID=A0A8J2KFW1_9HEXA|nr:unnamed protein product [Allacma fusca]